MSAEFVKRIQMQDFDSSVEFWVERQEDMIVFGLRENDQATCVRLEPGDAVILAHRIRDLAVAPAKITYAQESDYPDF